jgi:putative ABC transport system permease protein
MIITFATVGVSAYRVSYLNIVSAVRNLPENLIPAQPTSLISRLLGLLKGIFRPLVFLWRALRYLIKLDFVPAILHVIFAVVWLIPIVWIVDILIQLFKLIWPYLLQGWLLVLLGIGAIGAVVSVEALQRWSLFGGGVSMVLAGTGLLARTILARTDMRPELRDRVVFSATGITILVFWALPGRTFEAIVGDLQGDFDVMFVSGIAMVGAAVWTVMYNADLILKALQVSTNRFRQLRPVLVTAVAYPLSAKFRTGLTLAMFALVIFTLTIMSVLTQTFGTQFAETRIMTGGWDIEGEVNLTTPIDDIRGKIEETETIQLSQFEAIGGYTGIPVQVRELEAKNQQWNGVRFIAADDGYLASSTYDLKLIADGFGSTREEVFQAMRDDPSLVVVGGSMLDDTQGQQGEAIARVFNEVSYDDESMSPIDIEVRERTTRTVVQLTVIGVVDRIQDSGFGLGIVGSKTAIQEVAPFPIPITTYRFRVVDLDQSKDIAQNIERSFLANGMETVVLEDFIDEQFAVGRSIFRLFTGFMALGLFVGIAALGVVSTRAVVERRQQIGMLRALGYRRSMIQLSFLLESSFIALLGVVIGTVLGLILSYNAVADIRSDEGIDTITFAIPWAQTLIILGLTYFFSLLATYIPARQASRIYPAEALRYE